MTSHSTNQTQTSILSGSQTVLPTAPLCRSYAECASVHSSLCANTSLLASVHVAENGFKIFKVFPQTYLKFTPASLVCPS